MVFDEAGNGIKRRIIRWPICAAVRIPGQIHPDQQGRSGNFDRPSVHFIHVVRQTLLIPGKDIERTTEL
jgi:hypothetical protein